MSNIRPAEKAPLISVVIPVFNGTRYLARTLESLLAQTFDAFEVICVDDCSTDDSLQLLQSFAARDRRLRIFKNPDNLGIVPKTINRMIPALSGDYFVYSSQDDFFSRDWLERMYATAIRTGADAVVPEVVLWHEQHPEKNRSIVGVRGDCATVSGREAAVLSLDWVIPGNALWNINLVRRLGYAEFAMNGDEYSASHFYLECDKVAFCDGVFYYRQDNPAAITKRWSVGSFDIPYTHLMLCRLAASYGLEAGVAAKEFEKALQQLFALRVALWGGITGVDRLRASDRLRRAFDLLAEPDFRSSLRSSLGGRARFLRRVGRGGYPAFSAACAIKALQIGVRGHVRPLLRSLPTV